MDTYNLCNAADRGGGSGDVVGGLEEIAPLLPGIDIYWETKGEGTFSNSATLENNFWEVTR